jgi:methanogenic corrinoid protein MtbC1
MLIPDTLLETLNANGLQKFQALRSDAVSAVTERFYAVHGSAYERFGSRGRQACREDLAFHLDFLHPVLEFGLLQPMLDYLSWLASILNERGIPVEHVAQSLDWLAEFYAAHLEVSDGLIVTLALQAARTNFLDADNAILAPPKSHESWPEMEAFEVALLSGDHFTALSILNSYIDRGHSLVEIEHRIIQPALYLIGEKWQSNQVSVAQEHIATAIAHLVMTAGLLRSIPQSSIGKRVLLACIEGNNHAVGLRMVADAFQLDGWEVQYLGANVPTSALVRQIVEWHPDLTGLSVSFAHQLQTVKQVIVQLHERLGDDRPVTIVGGLAINQYNQLAEMVGADAYCTDARAAVLFANQMIKRQR